MFLRLKFEVFLFCKSNIKLVRNTHAYFCMCQNEQMKVSAVFGSTL